MNTFHTSSNPILFQRGLPWALVCLILGWAAQPRSASGQASAEFMQKLRIEKTDIDRQGWMPNTFAPVVKKVLPAVVSISSARVTQRRKDPVWDEVMRHYLGENYNRQQQGLGSGVLVTSDGFIITNYHVIQGANEVTVTLPKTKENYLAEVMAADPSTDVALLKIEGREFPRATLADSDRAEVGDVVLAVGNPFELDHTVTQGIVSAIGRSNVGPGGAFYGDFIQADAAINPGNSGGALVDSSGRVIGINTMIYSTTGASTGIGFAIPTNMALRVLRSLIDEGRVTRGYLGVQLDEVDPARLRQLGRRDASGAEVGSVVRGSPAHVAGLRPGDLIVTFNGQRVVDRTRLRLQVSGTEPGTVVTFGIIRNGRPMDAAVRLGEIASKGSYVVPGRWKKGGGTSSAPSGEPRRGELETPFYLEGVSTQTLDDSLRRQLGLDAAYEGAVVVQINPRSPAGKRGVQVGDLIVEVGRRTVRSTREAYEAGQNLEGDSVVLGLIREGKETFVLVPKP